MIEHPLVIYKKVGLLGLEIDCFFFFSFSFFDFSRQRCSVALEHVLKLSLVYQAGVKITEIHLSLPTKF